jgi:hypothetical protein
LKEKETETKGKPRRNLEKEKGLDPGLASPGRDFSFCAQDLPALRTQKATQQRNLVPMVTLK